MEQKNSTAPKPTSEISSPELTRLPVLTPRRRWLRGLIVRFFRFLIWLLADVKVRGVENMPVQGPLLVVSNHLGDADAIVGVCYSPVSAEIVAKIELHDLPVLGRILDSYGVIYIHRGQSDRRAIRVILEALQEGRIVGLAPEGRESLTGALESGLEGAAYIAIKANCPLLPVTFIGTRNETIYGNLKRLRRSHITVTIGSVFSLPVESDLRESVRQGTDKIMNTLAAQLPGEYQGVYQG